MLGRAVREDGPRFGGPRLQSTSTPESPIASPRMSRWLVALASVLVAGAAGGGLGLAVGAGFSTTMLVLGLLAPFGLMLVLARPHWASIVYMVLVYTDLLSILVRYHDFPALARYAGVALVTAVLGYRLFVQRERLASDRLTWWLLAYGLMVAVGVVYARSPDLVVSNVIEFVRSFFTYLIVINTLTTIKRVHIALYAIMAAGVFLATLTVFQTLTGQFDQDFGGLAQYRVSDIAGDAEAARPGGTIGDANYYGQLLLVVVPIALYLLFDGRTRLARLVGLACAGILTVAVIFTYSRGDALALGAIAIAAVIFKRPNPLLIVGGVIALVLALPLLPSNYMARLTTVLDVAQGNQQTIYGEDSIRGRAGATQAAIEMFADHPLFGVGRENYPLYQLEYLSGTGFAKVAKGIPPHNLYLEVAAEHGVMGILVFGGLLLVAWGALMDARRRFKWVRATREYELTGWLAIAFIGYLVTAVSLHGAFLYILWMIISLIAAVRLIARSYTPVLTAFDTSYNLAMAEQAAMVHSTDTTSLRARLTRPLKRVIRRVTAEQPTVEVASTGQSEATGFLDNDSMFDRGDQVPVSPLLTTRPLYIRRMKVKNTAEVARLETWLSAGEAALRRGDWHVARAMVELALERDPYNPMAWDMDLRIRMQSGQKAQSGRYVVWASEEKPIHNINDKMLNFWHDNGGMSIFGYPVSPRFYEVSLEGEMIEVQYFERARLEYRVDKAGTPEEMQTGCLGKEISITGSHIPSLPSGLDGEQVIFGAGLSVPRRFFDFWEANGGPDILGQPISPVLQDATTSSPVWIQYFEKACLEYHPRLAGTVYAVQVSRLGEIVFRSKYERKVTH